MLNCSLSKNKSYQVQNIFFNSTDKSYQLTLAEKPATCADGVFSSKKLELKIVPNNTTPFLRFNKQDGVPELVLNNMSLVKQANAVHTKTTEQNPMQSSVPNPGQNSGSHFSFLYVILGIVVIILIIRFIAKRKQPPPYFPGNNNLNNPNNLLNGNNNPNNPNNSNNPNFNPNNNPYNNQNNGPMGQPPSRTGSFLTGLAGGALGAVVGNELYNKFKGNDANAAQNPNDTNSNDTFSSDNDSNFNNNNDSFSGDDNSSDDSFSSDD